MRIVVFKLQKLLFKQPYQTNLKMMNNMMQGSFG